MIDRMGQYLQAIAEAFVADGALCRGASISFNAVTSIGPVLFIVVAIAGLVLGEDVARGAVSEQLSTLMGKEAADLVQRAVQSASGKSTGIIATVIGVITLLITASGVFGEMQSALNTIWKVESHGTTITRLVRARAASLGLVAALGFLLLSSLVITALISALADINARLPFGALVLQLLNFVMSFALISVLVAAIYKVLPDAKLTWRDVLVGAIITALLFNLGKFLIGLYLAHSAVASSYGAAGALIVILMWVYYWAQIFLLGAEFTKIHARRHGTPGAVRRLA